MRRADAHLATALPAELAHGPTPAECARQLRAAYEASAHDDGQRLLLRELMAHYREWCLERRLADPFAPVPERLVARVAVARADTYDTYDTYDTGDEHADAPTLQDLVLTRRRPFPTSGAETAARSLAPVTRAAG